MVAGTPFGGNLGVLGAPARLPGVLAGFAADLGLGLRPDQRGEALGDARGLNKVVSHVDKEFEGEAEAVFNEARRNKYGLRGAEGGVAMANGAVAEFDGVVGGDKVLAGVGNCQWNEVVGALVERGGERGGHGADQPLQIGVGDAVLAPGRVTDAVGGLLHGHLRGHLLRMPKFDLCTAGHEFVF